MIADRPYRSGMAPEEARTELGLCSGTQFDPVVVEAFLETLAGVGPLGLAGVGP
jgi:HD-GYP domain-containing protein (c-di-GMP phosphodiesterase class II)